MKTKILLLASLTAILAMPVFAQSNLDKFKQAQPTPITVCPVNANQEAGIYSYLRSRCDDFDALQIAEWGRPYKSIDVRYKVKSVPCVMVPVRVVKNLGAISLYRNYLFTFHGDQLTEGFQATVPWGLLVNRSDN
jgi:hypothetical protein